MQQSSDGQYTPPKAVTASAIAFLRVWLGIMWLFEVTVGHNWKIGGFASGPNPRWMGSGAGDAVREESLRAIDDGTYSWFASLFDSVIIPNAEFSSYLVIVFQIALGVLFIIGFAVRPMAVLAIGMDVAIFMLGNSRIPPFFTAMHLFVLVSGAGAYYGLDGWILERTRATKNAAVKAGRWLLELPVVRREFLTPAVAAFSLLGVYFFLTMGSRATPRFTYVAMELAALSGLAAIGIYAYLRSGDRIGSLTTALRIFIGFKFLHEIWARTSTGANALPGWSSVENQTAFYETVVENHWSLFGSLVDAVILPAVGFWAVLFGVVQLVVGSSLLIGYRSRLFGLIGLGYLTVLIGMGFTRLAPFLFGLLVVAVALDGGRLFSLDGASTRRTRFGLPIPAPAVPALIALAAVNAVAAAITAFSVGITPDAYVDSMRSMVTAFVAIISGTLAFAGWLQRHPSLDHSDGAQGEVAIEVTEVAELV